MTEAIVGERISLGPPNLKTARVLTAGGKPVILRNAFRLGQRSAEAMRALDPCFALFLVLCSVSSTFTSHVFVVFSAGRFFRFSSSVRLPSEAAQERSSWI